ncbi:hypothetical protein VMCG_07868 [Cytospora schulzeri]|uniref:Extracellular membrane protein CFEM domain-containing protein n=1 Tax=Cytospora schulzeri TaxID=448051 RepID=A0A423W0B9_9PEZI|nr:hypothetical protein VMCG_07868 [Valsa malicola]
MAPNLSLTLLLTSLLTTFITLTLASQEQQPHHFENWKRDYAIEVCSPNTTTTTTTTTDPLPPCIDIQNIESACIPNGTEPIDYAAHAQCMCTGSYFSEWAGCQACLYFHGLRTEREEEFYESVVTVASHSLCDFLTASSSSSGAGGAAGAGAAAATPTTDFAAIFSAVQATMTQPTTGGTVSSDQAPDETAVSLYYTLSGSQGPGAITGSAASAATATAETTTSAASETSGSSSSSSSSSRGGSKTAATTTTKPSKGAGSEATGTTAGGAAPSGQSGGNAGVVSGFMLMGLAGLAVVASLL